MTSYYVPQPAAPGGGYPPCTNCGAQLRLHQLAPNSAAYDRPVPNGALYLTSRGMQALLDHGERLLCPIAYRPEGLAAAIYQLAAANTAEAIFAARGEVQRHMDHRPAGVGHCPACTALVDTSRT